jgi:hypothetical protein
VPQIPSLWLIFRHPLYMTIYDLHHRRSRSGLARDNSSFCTIMGTGEFYAEPLLTVLSLRSNGMRRDAGNRLGESSWS